MRTKFNNYKNKGLNSHKVDVEFNVFGRYVSNFSSEFNSLNVESAGLMTRSTYILDVKLGYFFGQRVKCIAAIRLLTTKRRLLQADYIGNVWHLTFGMDILKGSANMALI